MSPSVITVKYVGKFDAMTCDYNHKRYCFRSKERVSTIPTEVYDFIKQNKDLLSQDLIPYQEADQKENGEAEKSSPAVFVTLSMKEYRQLSKEDKENYRLKKAEAEKANVK